MQRGDRLAGRFEIIAEAARGGMGTVFRARDHRSRRDVALKILATSSDDDVARFEREAAILAALHHDNIVEYVASGAVPDGPRFLAMAWVNGETLAARLERTGVDAGYAITIASQLARALAALHDAGVVHRDVKPTNVMLVDDRVMLVDFGIARHAANARLTRTGTLVGTAGYMAPEQARGDREIDGRADLFALGCVLYECLCGEPAFRGANALALRAMVLLHDPPAVSSFAPDVPVALDALVASLVAREPANRPTTAAAVADALAAIELGARTLARRPAAPRDAETVVSRSRPSCAVLVATDDSVAAARLAGIRATSVHAIDGGVVVSCASLAEAVRIAIELESLGVAAIGCGDSPREAIDRSARLIERVDLAAATADVPAAGAWIDAADADRLETAGERHGDRVRLRRGS